MSEIILVFGDLHHARNLARIEELIREHRPRRTVFLGDYFDQWHDQPADAGRTAEWLKASLGHADRVHLFGNHDLPYAFPENPLAACPGFTLEKYDAIRPHLNVTDWAKLHLHHWDAGFLFTHAGWSRQFLSSGSVDPVAALDSEVKAAWSHFHAQRPHWVWGIGWSRGGSASAGGLLWCDVHNEFRPIPRLAQIFGHTPTRGGKQVFGDDAINWCIDTTTPDGPTHYALIEGGKITLQEIPA